MVKFAQHIQWHSERDGGGGLQKPLHKTADNEKPRKTLAQLFESSTAPSKVTRVTHITSPVPATPVADIKRTSSAKKISDLVKNEAKQRPKSAKSGPVYVQTESYGHKQSLWNYDDNYIDADATNNTESHEIKSSVSKFHLLEAGALKKLGAGHLQGFFIAKGIFAVGHESGKKSWDQIPEPEPQSITVEIPEKMIGLAWFDSKPLLLASGSHTFPSRGFILEQVISEKSSFVNHGYIHRVRIRDGHLGVAWVDGRAVLLQPGVTIHSCPPGRFSYIVTDDKLVSEKEFVLGPFRVVTVYDSEVGIKFCNRQPEILYSGRHCLSISRLEVFAGFESLLKRQSNVNGVSAMSSDNLKVTADIWMEWQIKPEDAAAARVANITDVESAVSDKIRRAFNLVIWEVNAQEMKQQLGDAIKDVLKNLSSSISRECSDLFEEGWTVTLWDLQVKKVVILSEPEDTDD